MKTMDTWARQVTEEQEIPESFTTFFESLPKCEPFPYTVFAPPEKGYHRKSTPKLLMVLVDRIYIAEKAKKQIQTTCFLFQDINYLETGTLLLHSWLAINGLVDGKPTMVTAEYNTVVEEIFKQIIEKIRSTIHHLDQGDFAKAQLKKEQSKFEALIKTNFKYMNYGKRSLLAGENLQQFILQPDIQVKFLKYFQHTLSFTHLTILTDQELIMVKDDDSFKKAQHARYGGIWRYISLHKVIKLTVENVLKDDLIKLNLILPGEVSFSFMFSASQRPELDLLLHTVNRPVLTQRECV
jgi:hypothetical protein